MQVKRTQILKKIEDKRILITGGTGSFGQQIASALLNAPVREVRVFSRDEDLQHQMATRLDDNRLKFVVGDVRDGARVEEAMQGIDFVLHAAALKQVPDCELHPLEAVKTNVIGADNVKHAAERAGVSALIFISTDKAVKPVNAMGMSKALQEKLFLSPEFGHRVRTCGVRYGNVLGSRGSVVPHFADLKRRGKPLVVTHPEMTRFMLTLDDATNLVFKALSDGKDLEMLVMKRPSCRILDLAEVISNDQVPVTIGGIRAGEKVHETLVQEEEMRRCAEDAEFYRIRPFGSKDLPKLTSNRTEYTSENTARMTKKDITSMLEREGWL